MVERERLGADFVAGVRVDVARVDRDGLLPEADFLAAVAERADCHILLDLNNIVVNHKNHGGLDLAGFVARVDLARVSYLHVAGHEFDARFGLHIDTHSEPVEHATAAMARVALRFDLPAPKQAAEPRQTAPGMDPNRPPRLV